MLFGMGTYMSREDDDTIADVVAPAWAALGLANDYFSFDQEYAEWSHSACDEVDRVPLTNAVWLCMQWHATDVHRAKQMVRDETLKYEGEFQAKRRAFLHPPSGICPPERFWKCLDGLSQMIIGNIIWSLKCPRYHPSLRYDPNAGVENYFLSQKTMPSPEELRSACERESRRDVGRNDCATNSHATVSCGSIPNNNTQSTRIQVIAHAEADSLHGTSMTIGETGAGSANSPSRQIGDDLLDNIIVREPYDWCASLPSKHVRNVLIDAVNVWVGATNSTSNKVKSIIDRLHNSSLILDDIEDSSQLRRGFPAAHTVFGIPETVNAANFAILKAIGDVRYLANSSISLDTTINLLERLFIGQSYDLRWARQKQCPSEMQYLKMVDSKTGALFHLLASLLLCNTAERPYEIEDTLIQLLTLLGRYFQIRDDLLNMSSGPVSESKGYCEDLDNGTFSFPIIKALTQNNEETCVLRKLLLKTTHDGPLSNKMKELIVKQLREHGFLEQTKETLATLEADIQAKIQLLETITGCANWILRLLIHRLRV